MFVNPAGSGKGYQIANSVRFRAAASAYFSRTPGVAGNSKLLCGRFRIKRGTLGALQVIASAGTASIDRFYFDSSDRLCLDVLGTTRLVTTAVYRDPSAHYVDVGFQLDVANGTAALRAKILINGTEVGSYSTDTRSSITNTNTNWNAAVVHYIGKDNAGNYFDGYLSEPSLVDGSTSITYSTTDTNGVPIPSQPNATWGTCGSYLKFDDGTSATTLGYDRSGNGNNWAASGISTTAGVTYDWLTDTPTNSYATLNPLNPSGSGGVTFADANLALTATNNAFTKCGIPITQKTYYEVTLGAAANTAGVMLMTAAAAAGTIHSSTDVWYYKDSDGNKVHNDYPGAAFGASYTSGDVIGVAVDPVAGKAWFSKNGSWQASGDPANGTNPAFTGLPSEVWAGYCVTFTFSTTTHRYNLGQRPFSYTPPAGFKSLNTANLPAVAIPNPSNGFKVTLDTGANIDASVATARSGWPAYLDIKKVRNTTGSWLWQFSHDSSNEYAIAAASVTRQAKSSLTGGNTYAGYSIRIDSAYGTAAGSVSHTNGADTTVTHNLGISARQLILLFPRAGGSTVRMYHPDLTAGNLLDLCSTNGQAVSATIKTVTSTSFKIDSGTATGTYDYLVISELSGYFKLFGYTGNGAADGPLSWLSGLARMLCRKITGGSGGSFLVGDTARDTSNVVNLDLRLDANNAENSGSYPSDITASSWKVRSGPDAGQNTAATAYVGFCFLQSPFGGSNVSPCCAR